MARNKEIPRDWFVCPHCGADVLRGAKSCKECGSDAETGWAPEAKRWDAEIESGGFDYDEYITREFPEHPGKRPPWDRFVTARKLILLALIVLALLVLASVLGVRMR